MKAADVGCRFEGASGPAAIPPDGRQLKLKSTEEPSGHTAGQQWPTGDSGCKKFSEFLDEFLNYRSDTVKSTGTCVSIFNKIYDLTDLCSTSASSRWCSTSRNKFKNILKEGQNQEGSLHWQHIYCLVVWCQRYKRIGDSPL